MKKVFIIILTPIFLFSCQPSNEKVRDNFLKQCTSEIDNIPDITADEKKVFNDYCNCSADKILAKYSVAEIAEMEKKGQQSFMKELQPILQPCFDEMFKEMQQFENVE